MSDLLTRSIYGLIFVVLFVTAALYSQDSFIIFTTFLGLMCAIELCKMIQLKSAIVYVVFAVIIALVATENLRPFVFPILVLTVISSLALIFQLFYDKELKFYKQSSKIILVIRYVIFSTIFLAFLPVLNGEYYPLLSIALLAITWANDSFAFLIGKNFGKRKLFPSVSPKKTQEGFVGGFVASLLTAVFINNFNIPLDLFDWLLIAILISSIGTIGDLIESKFKRRANIKDSGSVLPGHGGVFDRMDSLLFAAPFVYLYIHYIVY